MTTPVRPGRKWVCEGCWKRGQCLSAPLCTCPCTKEGWQHADDSRVTEVFPLEPGVEY